MFELNEKVQNLIPYDPVTGKYRIRLDANESFVTPSQALREQIDEELRISISTATRILTPKRRARHLPICTACRARA